MDYQAMYAEKRKTPEEAVSIVRDGDWVDYGQTCSYPQLLDRALSARSGELKDVKIRSSISMVPIATVENDPGHSFTYNLWHCSGIDRKYLDQGRAFHSPMLFRQYGSYYRKGYAPVNVAMITVSPMDRNGNFSYGLSNAATQEIVDAAERVIVEVNPTMPTITGIENDHINIRDVSCLVESELPVPTVKSPAATDIDREIASYIFPYVTSGCTLQLGIGGIPNSIGSMIAESDVKDLGMHTELMSDGYLDLCRAGRITNSRKKVHRGKGIFSVCNGSRELYDYLDHSESILSAPMRYVNDPQVIRELDDFISITMEAEHGRAFLAMHATFTDREGKKHSNILPHFSEGDIITTPRSQAPFIVTEYGIAALPGKTTWQRAEALIGIAHPDFREDLIKAAEEQKIWRQSSKR